MDAFAGAGLSAQQREMADYLLGKILLGEKPLRVAGGVAFVDAASQMSAEEIAESADLPEPYRACARAMVAALGDEWVRLTNGTVQRAEMIAAHKVLMRYAKEQPELYRGFLCLDPGRHKTTWHLSELMEAEFPEQVFTLPGLLPTGLAVLAARPKIGKSWLAVQLSWLVGSGGRLWGAEVPQGRVLYLALEDSPRRIMSRLRQQKADVGANVWYEFDWPAFDREGLQKLIEEIERERFALVVVDTLARALGNLDPSKQAEMSTALGLLQSCAIRHNMTILLIDHHRKLGGLVESDPIEDLLGATGKAGVIDVAMGLYRGRGQNDAVLKMTGRDIDERELAIRFDRETGLWECLGDAETVITGQQEEAILNAIIKLGAPSHQEITDTLQVNRGNCFKRIQALLDKGQIRRIDGRPARFMAVAAALSAGEVVSDEQ